MARYRLLSPHVIDGELRPAGTVLETDIPPTPDMEPLDADAVGRIASMPWADRGWRLEVTAESLPGGRHSDGSPVLLNRPENLGAPLALTPPQPRLDREIPPGTASEPNEPHAPPAKHWARHPGSIGPHDTLIPYSKE